MVKNRISSQYVFGYQKFILYPEDYKVTKSGKKKVRLPELVGKGYGTFWRWKGRYRVCKGSRASKKSKTTALWYITNMMKYPQANTLVVRKTFRTLKDSCFTELKWAIHRLGVDAFWEIKESPLEMTYKPTGQKIYFRGLDDPLKVTSITVDIGCLCWMWIEEAYEISSEDDFNMLDESIRGAVPEGSGLFKQITLTLNPWNEHHWIKKRFFDTPDDETLAMTTNYKCNEWLDKADLKVFETMKKQNPRRYKVAGLGDWGIVDGLVYENWEEKAFSVDEVKKIAGVKSVFGLDFGYTNDPSALFCGLIDQSSKTIWVFDEMYQPGMSNEAIAEQVQRMGYVKEKITADSISGAVSQEMKRDAIVAVTIATICMLIYIWFRFSNITFAAGAVLALMHDVLVVLTCYAMLRWSVGSTFIACMLTIVGYSINATIVIFDRIRENMKLLGNKESAETIVNTSISQTLTRSINTTLTTFVMVLILYILGVSSIREFALPLMVGLICGTYSSVCLSGSVWYVLNKKRMEKNAKPAGKKAKAEK